MREIQSCSGRERVDVWVVYLTFFLVTPDIFNKSLQHLSQNDAGVFKSAVTNTFDRIGAPSVITFHPHNKAIAQSFTSFSLEEVAKYKTTVEAYLNKKPISKQNKVQEGSKHGEVELGQYRWRPIVFLVSNRRMQVGVRETGKEVNRQKYNHEQARIRGGRKGHTEHSDEVEFSILSLHLYYWKIS